MDTTKVLMWEATHNRLTKLVQKAVIGEWLSFEERKELAELYNDDSEMILSITNDAHVKSQDHIKRLFELAEASNKNTHVAMKSLEHLDSEIEKSKLYGSALGVTVNFIEKNGLEEQYLDYLEEVSMNETEEYWKKGAEYAYREHENCLINEYGWTVEERHHQ